MAEPNTTPDQRWKALARRYIETVNLGDPVRVAALYTEDATIEDPIGAKPLKGRAAIQAFYEGAFSRGPLRMELQDEPWGALANAAAYSFRAKFPGMELRAVGMLIFDEAGQITTMRAFHGPSDRKMSGAA